MKITLVNCPFWTPKTPPLNLAYLNSFLINNGHTVFLLDFNIEAYSESDIHNKYLWTPDLDTDYLLENSKYLYTKIDEWCSKILSSNTQIIGFSVYQDNESMCMELAKKIKRKKSSKIIVFGGPQCCNDIKLQELFSEKVADIIVRGEGEQTFLDIVNNYDNIKKPLIKGAYVLRGNSYFYGGERNSIKNLDDLPFPDFSGLPLHKYTRPDEISILSSRGCFGKCAFCQDYLFLKDFRYRSAENIYSEMLIRFNQGYRTFFFSDLSANGNLNELETLCDFIIHSKMHTKISLYMQFRSRIMKPKIFKKLKQAGLDYLLIGVESGSQSILRKMQKGYTIKIIEANLKDATTAGIKTDINIVIGFPGENEKTVSETIEFIRRNRAYIGTISAFYDLTLRPGSPIDRNPSKYGIKFKHWQYWYTKDKRNTFAWRICQMKFFLQKVTSMNVPIRYDETQCYHQLLHYYFEYLKDYKKSYDLMNEAIDYFSRRLQQLKQDIEFKDSKVLELMKKLNSVKRDEQDN